MKISIWLYDDRSKIRSTNLSGNFSNFRIFYHNELFKGTEGLGLLIYPKNYEGVASWSFLELLKQNRKMLERFKNHNAVKYLESNV